MKLSFVFTISLHCEDDAEFESAMGCVEELEAVESLRSLGGTIFNVVAKHDLVQDAFTTATLVADDLLLVKGVEAVRLQSVREDDGKPGHAAGRELHV